MKLSELRKMPIVSLSEATKLGVVSDVFVDPRLERILGLEVAAEGRGDRSVVSIDQVRAIGRDVVTISGLDALTVSSQVGDASQRLALNSIVGHRVVAEDGEVLGSVSEVEIDPESARVRSLEYGPGGLSGLFGGSKTVSPASVIGIGAKVLTIRRESESSPESSRRAS